VGRLALGYKSAKGISQKNNGLGDRKKVPAESLRKRRKRPQAGYRRHSYRKPQEKGEDDGGVDGTLKQKGERI